MSVRGTNLDGQCVIKITAPKKDVGGAAADATRGTHSIAIAALSGDGDLADYTANTKVDTVSVDIQVGGAPASVTSDATEYIDPLSSTKVTYTVWDDEDVRVGAVDVVIDQIEGSGKITAGEGTGRTKDGQGSFTFRAPLNEGTAVFLVTVNPGKAGEIQQPISVVVGTAMVDVPVEPDVETPVVPDVETPVVPDVETPVMEDATLTGSGSIRFFSGGSVDDLSAAAAAACPGGAIVWVQADDGAWPAPLSTTAPAFANAPFTAAFPDGFDGPTGVWVSSCDEGDMDNEGDMDEGDAG